MASASRKHNLTGVFPQRKKATVASGKDKRFDKSSGAYDDVPVGGASLGGGSAQPAALITSRGGKQDLSGDYDEIESTLRQFDMNMAYGPCLGITRMERWERATRLGLSPPSNVRDMIVNLEASQDCLWEGRV
ncbi:DNA polymerase delta subunit 4 [Marchantia polymorpha subsp. ruderalis]|uniref:DNA polymerase delta subunit 4 n=2 Tax=Marchantia polymorpha TaxID=3197 RepID=A0A176WLY2_MARPO|nr:hypothetical protein AXG93_4142s1340 [Marchantia polymorpha subsp. ruderalis]PTQ49564.1 hypothetical protein MARPO_0002s0066 [Marchantia polymorpha]BBN00319.1 hypothetical protein Mp_1g28120 [Marchantia polymorpha subsp. ruderalis]|eukprot:PTQ49564.1 hypothetical protein MARPO_0002s0066 [Marchantia polymorpha]